MIDWEIRKGKIGASDVPRICGLIGSPQEVWDSKVADMEHSAETKFAFSRGNAMEPVIAHWLAEQNGWYLSEGTTMRHSEIEWACATPDYWISACRERPDSELLEIKDVSATRSWECGPPDYVIAQVQWQLEVCGSRHATIGASLGGGTPRTWRVERDEDVIREIVRICGRFYDDHIATGLRPGAARADVKTLSSALARSAGWVSINIPRVCNAAERYHKLGQEIATLESERDKCADVLKSAIGDNEGMTFDGGKATWRQSKSMTDWKGLAMCMKPTEEDIQRHQKPGARVLRVSLK